MARYTRRLVSPSGYETFLCNLGGGTHEMSTLKWSSSSFEVHVIGWGAESLSNNVESFELAVDHVRKVANKRPKHHIRIVEVQHAAVNPYVSWDHMERSRIVWDALAGDMYDHARLNYRRS